MLIITRTWYWSMSVAPVFSNVNTFHVKSCFFSKYAKVYAKYQLKIYKTNSVNYLILNPINIKLYIATGEKTWKQKSATKTIPSESKMDLENIIKHYCTDFHTYAYTYMVINTVQIAWNEYWHVLLLIQFARESSADKCRK